MKYYSVHEDHDVVETCQFCLQTVGNGMIWLPINKVDYRGHRVYETRPCPICTGWVPPSDWTLPAAAWTHVEIPKSERAGFHESARQYRTCEGPLDWEDVKNFILKPVERL